MSTLTTINAGDNISTSRTDINTNFSNLNADKVETSVLDTDTTLAGNSDARVATQKAVKAYVDTGGNSNASETVRGIVEEATDAEMTAGTATGATGAKLVVTPAKLATRLSSLSKFGGTGADGALTISSGATNIDLAGAAIVTKNYTSISITGTGSLTFTNPHANGTFIVLKSQGSVILTASSAPCIDASGVGAASATDGSGSSFLVNKGADGNTSAGNGGAGNALFSNETQLNRIRPLVFFTGAGGGVSGSNAGGRGGGCLLIECAGAWNFTLAGGISVAGKKGTNSSNASSGGGGGGAGGLFVGLYNTLTANSGTVTIAGGDGGDGTNFGGANPSPGAGGNGSTGGSGNGGNGITNGGADGASGGGGASTFGTANGANATNNGTNASATQAGGGGASGSSLVTPNTIF